MFLLLGCLAGPALFGCGDRVARETGTVQGELPWTGAWPEEGAMLVVLFEVPPWDPDFVPGPPAAFTIVTEPADGDPAAFSIASPGVPFGNYAALTAAWQDPAAGDQSDHMRPVAVWGTSLDRMEVASPVVLSEQRPDLEVTFESVMLYAAAEDMRSNYPPVEY